MQIQTTLLSQSVTCIIRDRTATLNLMARIPFGSLATTDSASRAQEFMPLQTITSSFTN